LLLNLSSRLRYPTTKIYWMLPDTRTIESTVSDVDYLLLLLKLVDTVSINANTYHVLHTELVIDSEEVSVSISLQ